MRRVVAVIVGVLGAGVLAAGAAQAQVNVQVRIGLPVVLPPLVVVQPGVQVVSEIDDEVYFVDGWYWARRGPYWYRCRTHRGEWVYVQPARVPVRLVRIPPGQYKHLDRNWKAERRYEKERRKAERAAWKEEEKGGKHHGKGRGHGHGRDD